jgi:hypothetical protein
MFFNVEAVAELQIRAQNRASETISKTVECPPIQVALALPLANRHLPVTR